MNSPLEYLEKGDFEDAEKRGWHGAGWYFWDEADGQYCYGPFVTKALAESAMNEYYDSL
jgi:hypothetical protein